MMIDIIDMVQAKGDDATWLELRLVRELIETREALMTAEQAKHHVVFMGGTNVQPDK
jgi:hypothetical protein